MRMEGLEPPRPCGHGDLNAARLPIPPHPRAAPTIAHPQRPTRPLVPSIAAHAPLSSRGLGRRPLTAETRVRIPVAVSEKPLLRREEVRCSCGGRRAPWRRARSASEGALAGDPALRACCADAVEPGAAVDGARGAGGQRLHAEHLAAATRDEVVAAAGVDPRRPPRPGVDPVRARPAQERAARSAAELNDAENVVPGTAAQPVDSLVAAHDVVPGSSVDDVVARAAGEAVVAGPAYCTDGLVEMGDEVIAGPGVDD